MVKTCMERAGSHPLDIHIVLDDYSKPRCHSVKEALALIIPEIERWRNLTIEAEYFGSIMSVFSAIRHQYAPELQSVTMTLDDTSCLAGLWHQSENSYLGIFGGGAPRLRSFELSGISLHYCHPPLESLKKLALKASYDSEAGLPLSYTKLRDILKDAPELEELSLQGRVVCHPEGRYQEPVESIVVPNLKLLEISAPGGETAKDQCEHISSICRIVNAPRLRSLNTSFMNMYDRTNTLDISAVPVSRASSSPLSSSCVPYTSTLPQGHRPAYQLNTSEATLKVLSESGIPYLFGIPSVLEAELKTVSSLSVSGVDSVRLQLVFDMLYKLSAEREEQTWRRLDNLTICSTK
ncbi:hypothetical protein ONZ45_g3778 [Pleurotus djamor]|nr:hypothetical protein ONZ45_g3778 [Pleurotus djamor]